jgi:hypothetical protein
MIALTVPPSWFARGQKQVFTDMLATAIDRGECPKQADGLGAAFRRGYRAQDRRATPYDKTSLGFAAYRAGCQFGIDETLSRRAATNSAAISNHTRISPPKQSDSKLERGFGPRQ